VSFMSHMMMVSTIMEEGLLCLKIWLDSLPRETLEIRTDLGQVLTTQNKPSTHLFFHSEHDLTPVFVTKTIYVHKKLMDQAQGLTNSQAQSDLEWKAKSMLCLQMAQSE
jgi:hypothetical protein